MMKVVSVSEFELKCSNPALKARSGGGNISPVMKLFQRTLQ